jgi:hypothetical protein
MSDPDAVFLQAKRLFEESGLPVPPVPAGQRQSLRTVESWCFATRDVSPMVMYQFEDYPVEALMGNAPEYSVPERVWETQLSVADSYVVPLIRAARVITEVAPMAGVANV